MFVSINALHRRAIRLIIDSAGQKVRRSEGQKVRRSEGQKVSRSEGQQVNLIQALTNNPPHPIAIGSSFTLSARPERKSKGSRRVQLHTDLGLLAPAPLTSFAGPPLVITGRGELQPKATLATLASGFVFIPSLKQSLARD